MSAQKIIDAITSGNTLAAQSLVQRALGKKVVEAAERLKESIASQTYGKVQDALKEAFEDDDVVYIKEDNFVLTFKDGSGKTVKWDRKGESAEAVKRDAEKSVSIATDGKGEIISCEPGTREDVDEEFGVDQQAPVPKTHASDAEGGEKEVTENEGIPGIPARAPIPVTHKTVEEDEDEPVLLADDDEDAELEEAINAYAIQQAKIRTDKSKTPEQRKAALLALKVRHQQERKLVSDRNKAQKAQQKSQKAKKVTETQKKKVR